MTLCLLRIVIIIVWTISACCGIPNLIFYDAITIPSGNGTTISFCMIHGDFNLKAYNVTNLLLWYLAPLVLMTIMYSRISLVLWQTSQGDAKKRKEAKQLKITFKKPVNNHVTVCGDQQNRPGVYHKARTADDMGPPCYDIPLNDQKVNEGYSSPVKHGMSPNDDETCLDDENSTLVKTATVKSKVLDDPDDTVAEDFEDDWPGHKSDPKLKMKYVGNQAKQSNTNTNGLRINYPTNSPKNLASANRNPPSIRFAVTKHSARNVEGALLARRRVIRLLIAVIISFAVCVLPYHVRVIWQTFAEPQISFWQQLIPPTTFVIYYLNSGLNPLLYAFLSANFRRSLWQVMTCQDTRGRNAASARSYSHSRTTNTTI